MRCASSRAQAARAAGPPQTDPWAPLRTLGWALAFVILAAALTGYIAFATFLINQTIYLAVLGSLLYLVDCIVQDGTEALLKPEAPVGARLLAMVGLRRNVLAQIVVILQGVARLAVALIAIAAVLEPWGVQSQDMFGALRAAYFGFSIGGVTLSLSSMIGAAAVFAVVLFLTRLLQDWLGSRLLPQTRLDAGVRNSVRTIFGYAGVIVAVLLAGAQIGLDVQKLALIAGGLSVGIGFGLQTIANNFVSGLILLWERTIRVGDWVVVGGEQGFVRAINARSTEIETFDHGALIVPNANLVTGVVKNWVHNDRVGRIIVSINVAYESDVEQVRDMLIAAAKAQDQVLEIPRRRCCSRNSPIGRSSSISSASSTTSSSASGLAATSISTSCAGCARRACASPTQRRRRTLRRSEGTAPRQVAPSTALPRGPPPPRGSAGEESAGRRRFYPPKRSGGGGPCEAWWWGRRQLRVHSVREKGLSPPPLAPLPSQ